MSTITLYDAYIPNFLRLLDVLDNILTKAESHAQEKGLDVNAEYINAAIYEDMKPFTYQVDTVVGIPRIITNTLTGSTHEELAGEATFAAFHARAEKARALLKTIKPEHINGRQDEVVAYDFGPSVLKGTVSDLLSRLVQPNLFFHLVTAYDILRSKGVPLGKLDYLRPQIEDKFVRT